MAAASPYTLMRTRWSALKSERSSWTEHWADLSRFVLPRTGRFTVTDRNSGRRKDNQIYDNTATRALRVLAAGLMSGMTSPARPWFRLTVPDPEMAKDPATKAWLAEVTQKILDVFASSNTYLTLHTAYEELGLYGTAASVVMDDFDSVLWHYHTPVGEYALASDYKGRVDTLFREFQKPVGEVVKEFGLENCSVTVRNLYNAGSLDAWVTLVHAIQPRSDRDLSKPDAKNKAWSSCYFELGQDNDKVLREGGFDRFPALVSRWQKQGGDIYGMSPAMETLGDIKQLQHEQLRKANAIDYQTKPPLQAPSSMKGRDADLLPGGITYVDAAGSQNAIRSMWDVNLNLEHLLADIYDVRGRIREGFYADLFLMLANDQQGQMTATEVAERHEEKMLVLGPVLERLHNELLEPLVETAFAKLAAAGALPPPPEAMQGMPLDVQFVSVLAQAQRAISTNSIDRFVGNIGAVAAFKPDVLDKFDADKWADVYADSLGIEPTLIVPGPTVALIRQQRAEAQAKAQQVAQAEQAASAAQKLGSVATQGGQSNAAVDMMNQFAGYGSPSGAEL